MGRRYNKNRGRVASTNWENAEKENADWERYYKELNLPDSSEWDAFKTACQTALPLTFRVTGSSSVATEIKNAIDNKYIPMTRNITLEGETVEAPEPLEFYPDNMAYKFNVSKTVIRRNKEFSKLQRFLVVETDAGNISRQEAVSMVPPLFMDIKPEHKVLDMCAAPGSKTAQLLEALHKKENKSGTPPSGFVVANDSDYRRSHLLVHQVKRLGSPNVIVTNHDAQFYPKLKVDEQEYLKFDRILCDVPCSGDGTMRKNVNVWKDWKTSNGLGLHTLQLNILLRGLQLLKPGGKLVYSTCSLNPIENESVVCEALRQIKGAYLVDVSNELPGLKRSPGVTNWKVANKQGDWITPEQADEKIAKSCFPPTEEEIARFNLDRCVRVYQHQQDTGGFFITVFQKPGDSELPSSSQPVVNNSDSIEVGEKRALDTVVPADEAANKKVKKEKLPRDAVDEPFIFLPSDHPVIEKCWEFYGIGDKFPRSSLLVRNGSGDPTRVIYYVAPALRPIMQLNEAKLKLVHGGIKMFSFQRNATETCEWRIQVESIVLVSRVLKDDSSRKVEGTLPLLKLLATETFPSFQLLEQLYPDFHSQISSKVEGCVIMKVPAPPLPKYDENGVQIPVQDTQDQTDYGHYVYPVWKGRNSCNLMLPKEELHEVRHRIFGIDEEKKKNTAVVTETNEDGKAPEEEPSVAANEEPQPSISNGDVSKSEGASK